MNEENQQPEAEEQTVSVEFEEQDGEVKAEAQASEETGTIVRDSSEDSDELENYSENVQKRINQLTAKRKQALEESEAAYNYANQMKAQNDELRKRIEDLDKGYISEYGSRVETQEAAAKRILKEAYDAGDTEKIAAANSALAQLAVEKERLRVQKARSEQQAQAEKDLKIDDTQLDVESLNSPIFHAKYLNHFSTYSLIDFLYSSVVIWFIKGCSGANTKYVAPKIVSGLVVNTSIKLLSI